MAVVRRLKPFSSARLFSTAVARQTLWCQKAVAQLGLRTKSVILLPLRPASLTRKNPQGRKRIHGKRPVGRKE